MVNTNMLKGKIVSCGFTQKTLAKSLGMGINTINAKVNGRREFTVSEANLVCEVLKIEDSTEKCLIFLQQ